MRTAAINCTNNSVNLICCYFCTGHVISTDTVTFNHCLTDQQAILHGNVLNSHQIGSGSIDNNTAETRGS